MHKPISQETRNRASIKLAQQAEAVLMAEMPKVGEYFIVTGLRCPVPEIQAPYIDRDMLWIATFTEGGIIAAESLKDCCLQLKIFNIREVKIKSVSQEFADNFIKISIKQEKIRKWNDSRRANCLEAPSQ